MNRAVILIVLAYRLIPAKTRGLWKRNGSTSHMALAGLRAGQPWREATKGPWWDWFGNV